MNESPYIHLWFTLFAVQLAHRHKVRLESPYTDLHVLRYSITARVSLGRTLLYLCGHMTWLIGHVMVTWLLYKSLTWKDIAVSLVT